ncbi:hypothetical protein Tco_0542382 [Tanacetum coccineum]
MRSNELYKFSDVTLTRLLSLLEDITKNIVMEYLPKRRWSTLEKKRAHFMIKDINKLLKERRMMKSLEKFVGAGNPVKEILLKLSPPNHKSILTDSKIHIKMDVEGINSVMSDSDESGVTYTEAALQDPPSLDYVPGLEEPEQAPLSPDYVPGPEHADDEIVAEDQPNAEDASPTAQSPDYVSESDPEADPEEDDDEDPEEDPVDYPADGGDDRDDEDEPLEEDEDGDVDIEADEDEEEEEHPAPADSVVVALPTTDQAPPAKETKPFETDESAATPPPHPAYYVTARISIPALVPTPVWSDAEVARLLVVSTPPSSPLSPWSSPLPQIPSPPLPSLPYPSLPLSPPSPVLSPAPPPSPIHAPSSRIPPPLRISVPTSSPPLLLPSASHREDRPEVTLPPRKRPAGGLRADYGFVATMNREIRHDLERDVGYGITNSRSMDASDLSRGEVMSLRTTVLGQMSEIRELHAADHRRQAVTSEMLKADHRISAEMRELRTADHTR